VIRDRIINHAVRQAYGDALPAGRQPAYVLYLTLPLDRVDVNVHPTKHEVRFRDARLIHGLITRAVEEALAEPETEEAVQDELALTEPANRVNDSAASYRSSSEYTPTRPMRSSAVSPSNHHSHSLTLLHQRYAVLTSPAPELIDLQAADQALRREQFKQALSKGELASRAILVPVQHRLDEQQIDRLKQHQALLARFALVFDCQGNLASLKRMPYLLSQVDLTQLCDAVAATLTAAPTEDTFLAALLDLIPLSPVPSAAQAEQVLQQLDTSDIDQQSFRCKLDPTTLSGLFSV
jgi:DNA mismatch repair protein MutL